MELEDVVMNLINEIVINKAYGEGKVTGQSEKSLNVLFASGEKKFVFPDAFKGFLVAKDAVISDEIQKYLEKFESQKKRMKTDKLNEMQYKLEQQHAKTKSATSMAKKKMHACANIAFKCGSCDDNKAEEQAGFNEIASEQWKVFSGTIKTGVNKGNPTKLSRVRPNSLCVLTTLDAKATEKERYVFATYLVDETYESNGKEEGYVTTKSEYKIKLSPDEAKSLLFWNYHTNENHPDSAVWGSGSHRYFENQQAAQLLRDIAKIKKGTADEPLAERFFRHFCRINTINVNMLNQPDGVLSV